MIRPLAICVFRHGDRILVAQGTDDVKGESFYRPLGGEIEPGEMAEDTVRREIREEIGLEIVDPVRLGVLENVFEYRGQPGHEIVMVFDAQFADQRQYDREEFVIQEPVWDGPAQWIPWRGDLEIPLYPDGLMALLEENA